MRILSDVLTRESFRDILNSTGLAREGVYVWDLTEGRSRKRARGFTLYLAATYREGRRLSNSGPNQVRHTVPTYDEWGVFLAALFDVDPNAHTSYYDGREDFHRKTRDAYHTTTAVH